MGKVRLKWVISKFLISVGFKKVLSPLSLDTTFSAYVLTFGQ